MGKKKEKKVKIKKEIPDEIKVLFGKFYLFSFIYIIFFLLIYPFILVNLVSLWGSIIIFISLIGFYGYMIVDVIKHKGRFNSTMFILLILIVIMAISFSIVKFVV